MPTPKRPKITGITLTLLMPDGTTQVHSIDPEQSDALAWSDRAVEILGKFYDKGGPAEGKHMSREDLLHHFPHATAIIGNQPHLPLTPTVVNQLWNHPKGDGTAPAFLCKATYNIVNGK
jgi:hypothetical protein